MFDSHTHIQFPSFVEATKGRPASQEEVILRAKKAGIKMICVGTQYETSKAAIELALKYPEDIWASVGFHPTHAVSRPELAEGPHAVSRPELAEGPHAVSRPDPAKAGEGPHENKKWYHDPNEQNKPTPEIFDIKKFRKLAAHPKVVAIGECGLDYFRIKNDELKIKEAQKEIFIEQANLAKEFNKALMIHCRPLKGTDNAYEDLLPIIDNSLFSIPRILHFYVGSLGITKKLVDSGFCFTFGGVITFSRDYDEIIKYIPLERILLETDAPYVAPEPYRGKQNEPSYIIETAKKMAEIKNISYKKIVETTNETANIVFKLHFQNLFGHTEKKKISGFPN